jgi:hypothetical protein
MVRKRPPDVLPEAHEVTGYPWLRDARYADRSGDRYGVESIE